MKADKSPMMFWNVYDNDGIRVGLVAFFTNNGEQTHNGERGHFCGYVVCPEAKGMDWDEASDKLEGLDVHGGITYSGDRFGQWMIGWDYDHSYLREEDITFDTVLKDVEEAYNWLQEYRAKIKKGVRFVEIDGEKCEVSSRYKCPLFYVVHDSDGDYDLCSHPKYKNEECCGPEGWEGLCPLRKVGE